MKKEILKKLKAIEKLAKETGIHGTLYISFSPYDCTMDEFDAAVNSITEYPRWKQTFQIAEKLTVLLLF